MIRSSFLLHFPLKGILALCLAVGLGLGELYAFRPISVTKKNVALRGFDTVAYFREGKAVKGSPFYSIEWRGAVWQFSSRSNMHLFEEDPEQFAPEFGGYCSYGIGQGVAVSCNPKAFLIEEGKLYVMKNRDLLEIWRKDPKGYVVKARRHWLRLIDGGESSPKKGN